MMMVVRVVVHDVMMMVVARVMHDVMMVVMNRRGGVSGGRRGETDDQGRRNQQFLQHSLSP